MSMKAYHELKDMLCDELDSITKKGELTAGSLDTVDKLTHSIKSLETIIAMNEARDGESEYYPNYMRGSYRGRSYRRDAMGRYSRDDARADMVQDLRELMQSAPDEHMKKKLQRFISEIENA